VLAERLCDVLEVIFLHELKNTKVRMMHNNFTVETTHPTLKTC
jgi:hypothetical protein